MLVVKNREKLEAERKILLSEGNDFVEKAIDTLRGKPSEILGLAL